MPLFKHYIGTSELFILCVIITDFIVSISVLPLTAVAIIHHSVITNTFCYIQENITYIHITNGLMFPALMSLERWDYVCNNQGRMFTRVKVVLTVCGTAILSGCLAILPSIVYGQGDIIHNEGCHLWSEKVEDLVVLQVIEITIVVILSITLMILCYYKIYKRSKSRIQPIQTNSCSVHVTGNSTSFTNDSLKNKAKHSSKTSIQYF